MGPGSSKAELEREYLHGLGAAISRATEWREACVEAWDERDVALRRVAELEALITPEAVRAMKFMGVRLTSPDAHTLMVDSR